MKRTRVGVVGVVVALLAGVGGLAAGEDQAGTLLEMEKKLWQAWADGEGAPFEEMLIADAVAVTTEGRRSKAEVIAEITGGGCEITAFELMNPQVMELGEGAVLLTYEATQAGVCDGETIPAQVVAASIWVERDGSWKNAYYQESPIRGE